MKKISYYLIAGALCGGLVVSYWVYEKYFKVEQQSILVFQVLRGDVHESVKVRGEVVAQKEFDLEFPFAGTVERALVKEGQQVKEGDALLKLDTKELELEWARLHAVVLQSEAELAKLISGAVSEELQVSEAKVLSAEQTLLEAQKTLLDANSVAFTQADDAVHNKVDQFFNNPRTSAPSFIPFIVDSQLKTNLESNRVKAESMLALWKSSLPVDASVVLSQTETTKNNLTFIKSFLFDVSTAINNIGTSSTVSQATLDVWKASISTARTNVDTATTAFIAAEEKVRTAESSLALARSELVLKKSKPRNEDVTIAQSQIDQNKSALATIDEKIRKSTLRAPDAGIVKKIYSEEQETFNPGTSALLFASSGYKIRADISELDIGKVGYVNGNESLIRFDAFPEKTFKGKVVFIEPKEVVKDEDVYFRTDILLENHGEGIRSGMTADVVLYGVLKKDALRIPELAIYKREGRSFVKVARGAERKEDVEEGMLEEAEIVTGISDGEFIEVVQGLNERDFVAVSSD
ncbi:MAG: efflux RND transporter periplasmic adaptor subunit [Minisyncoccota bacterium]